MTQQPWKPWEADPSCVCFSCKMLMLRPGGVSGFGCLSSHRSTDFSCHEPKNPPQSEEAQTNG